MGRLMVGVAAAVLAPALATAASLERIDVFVVGAPAVAGADIGEIPVMIHRVDQVRVVRQALNENLPDNPEAARRHARQRLTDERRQALVDGYEGLIRARRLGVEKVPAVVLDERYVVYGSTDLERAIAAYREVADGN